MVRVDPRMLSISAPCSFDDTSCYARSWYNIPETCSIVLKAFEQALSISVNSTVELTAFDEHPGEGTSLDHSRLDVPSRITLVQTHDLGPQFDLADIRTWICPLLVLKRHTFLEHLVFAFFQNCLGDLHVFLISLMTHATNLVLDVVDRA